MIDVAVVVPTHNRVRLLSDALDSILNQSGVSLRVIVVNDGSTDSTGPWLRRIAARDPRVSIVHHDRPQRLPAARNAGMARASGRWVAFCDDDDLWAPNKLSAQLGALQSSGARWASTAAVTVNDKLQVIGHCRARGGHVLPQLLAGNPIWSGSSVIAELGLLRELGGFDQALKASEDWDMWIRLARLSPLAAVDRPLLAYRQAAGTMSTDVDRMRASRSIILSRYSGLAIEHGIAPADAAYERFLAKQLLRAGSGRQAAAVFANLVFKHRQWRELPRIPAAFMTPGLMERIGTARASAAVPAQWRSEAQQWLRRYQEKTSQPQPASPPPDLAVKSAIGTSAAPVARGDHRTAVGP